MQEQFFTQFVESFKQVFIQNIDNLFSLFGKYASGLFFSLATIEIVLAGLLIALSSSTSIYTLLTRIIKISIFFFIITHFSTIVQMVFNSVKYMGLHALSHTDASSLFGGHSKVSDLWNFNNPSNYVTEGLTNAMDSVSDYNADNADDQVNPQQTNSNNEQNKQALANSMKFSMSTWLGIGQFFALACTAALALGNIILFYFSALIALLLCPFGQLPLTANFFHASFSKFVGSGLRLLSFIIVFMLFNLLYNHIAHALPDLLLPDGDAGSYGYIDMSSTEDQGNDEQSPQLTAMINFMLALLGLFLCWFIPKEVSQKTGSFTIPTLPAETPSHSTVVQGAGNALSSQVATSSGIQPYASQQSPSAPVSATSSITSVASQDTRGVSAVTATSPSVNTQVNVTQKNQLPVNRTGRAGTHKSKESLHKQTSFLQQNFSQERASKLRQNFHQAIERSEK